MKLKDAIKKKVAAKTAKAKQVKTKVKEKVKK